MLPKVSIYVAYHKESIMPKKGSMHIPIHVGKALSKESIDGAIGDDTGHNISTLNPLYCELTATYWAWKNDHTSDYIGICHYRRYFSFKKQNPLHTLSSRFRFLKHRLFRRNQIHLFFPRNKCKSAKSFQKQIANFEIDLSKNLAKNSVDIFYLAPVVCNKKLESTCSSKIVKNTRDIIKHHFDQFYPSIDNLYQSKRTSYANMVIMKRELFDQYCTFLFGVLDKHRQMGYSPEEEQRLYGYIGENLTAAFIEHKKTTSKITSRELHQLFYNGH